MDIEAIVLSDGDPGYVVRGHVDLTEFLAAVREYEIGEGIIGPGDDCDYITKHTYQRDATPEEAREKGYHTFGFFCKLDEAGAYPITLARP